MTVSSDKGRSLPLPSGPASLCFDKDIFMKDNFDVDSFVMDCRRRVPLETLRDDLTTYLKILRSAMIELINKDYADFVNLSTNLVGMDKAIGNLTSPLCDLKSEVMNVKQAMKCAIKSVQEKLNERELLRQKKKSLQRLMNIDESMQKIEKLLGIHSTSVGMSGRPLNGQLIERVANEFNKLQFNVTKSKGQALIEKIKPRIVNITSTLQFSLEGHFLEGLDTNNKEILQQCLRTYAIIDKMKDVETLFRQHVVKPYMEEVITEKVLKSSPGVKGLQTLFGKILEFIPKHCQVLTDVTSGNVSGSSESIRGYDFLVNSVWPEIVCNIEAKISTIFAPGNPSVFHEKFLASMAFLENFEVYCRSKASIKRLREHPAYHTFITKWSLPVYYQIRFQEIGSNFESSLYTPFNNSADPETFHLHSSLSLWMCIQKCWSEDIYLQPLAPKFLKLTLQLLSRYQVWLKETCQQELEKASEAAEKLKKVSSASVLEKSVPDPSEKGTGAGDSSSSSVTSTPITITQILCLISDVNLIRMKVPEFFDQSIAPKLELAELKQVKSIRETVLEIVSACVDQLPQLQEYVVQDVYNQCSVYIRQVNDIPRLYRRTNKEIPSKPSTYLTSMEKPLQMFAEEHREIIIQEQMTVIFTHIFSKITEQFCSATNDVLISVKKMEDSLKRLKKVRGTDKSQGSQGMSDDDKIRQQIILDIKHFESQISSYSIQKENIVDYSKLMELSMDAKNAMSSQQ